ncbi:hypothetical protein BD560DRAFT_388042 [Blakeslea trispora]|nr:hypothetical protein BD560DRAFT_388042 [Blakeslea trispora]
MVASSSLPLFPQLAEMNDEEKYGIIARFIPCDQCTNCKGWHPSDPQQTDCQCGHDTLHHIHQGHDLTRKLKVALRLLELLEEKGKIDDYDYEDEDIRSLKKQIIFNATFDSEDLKRDRQHEENEQDSKRLKMSEDEPKETLKEDMLEEQEQQQGEHEDGQQEDGQQEEEEDQQEDGDNIQEEEEEEDQQEDGDNLQEEEEDQQQKIKEEKEEFMALIPAQENSPKDLIKEEVELAYEHAHPTLHDQPKEEDEVSRLIKELMPKERVETAAMVEERKGEIHVQVVLNDGSRESMILLTGLKNVFQKQLPKMPKEYIARLVYDRNHCSIALIRPPNKVFGGICYRPFDSQEFAEIVFCAVASTEQVKGYGSFIMDHLKDYVSAHTNIKHFLTYADNYAVGYFRKQGFTTDITLDKRKWVGYIKDYEGGTIMQCTVLPRVKYLQIRDLLGLQKNAILKKMKEKSVDRVYPGLRMPLGKHGKRSIDPMEVPGIAGSGWTPELDALSNRPRHPPHHHQMLYLVEEMQNYTESWPFLEPVSIEEVADYYDIIKDPMDLATLEENVKADAYPTMEDFVRDTRKIFDNCRIYNSEDTEYARCSAKLERFFNDKLYISTY